MTRGTVRTTIAALIIATAAHANPTLDLSQLGERFADTVEATPVPILVRGAEKLPNEIDALELAQRAVRAGARGVVFGRNVIQSQDPAAMISALHAVVKEDADPTEAAREAGLL